MPPGGGSSAAEGRPVPRGPSPIRRRGSRQRHSHPRGWASADRCSPRPCASPRPGRNRRIGAHPFAPACPGTGASRLAGTRDRDRGIDRRPLCPRLLRFDELTVEQFGEFSRALPWAKWRRGWASKTTFSTLSHCLHSLSTMLRVSLASRRAYSRSAAKSMQAVGTWYPVRAQ